MGWLDDARFDRAQEAWLDPDSVRYHGLDTVNCICGEPCLEDDMITCEICGESFCPGCYESAKDEVGGGLEWGVDRWNVCYGCAEDGLHIEKAKELDDE